VCFDNLQSAECRGSDPPPQNVPILGNNCLPRKSLWKRLLHGWSPETPTMATWMLWELVIKAAHLIGEANPEKGRMG